MTPIEITSLAFLVTKLLVVLGLFVYTVFAGVIVRQEQLMADVIEESFESILRLATVAHFVASVVVLLLAIILL